jgi:serine/threonine protein kinase/ankyrin repeat protein
MPGTGTSPGTGTRRLDAPQPPVAPSGSKTGPDGTRRLEAAQPPVTPSGPKTGPDGTRRLEAVQPPVAALGTHRLDGQPPATGMGPGGTRRLEAAPPAGGVPSVAGNIAPSGAGDALFSAGQTVMLAGRAYRIVREISASSGEAILYEVEHESAAFALKYYRSGIRMPQDVLQRIKVSPHENVLRTYEIGTNNDRDYEILDLARGGSLDKYLRDSGAIRDLTRLKGLAKNIVGGLRHLHETIEVIYQDLKPENILLLDDAASRVVLADFGISSVMQPGTHEAIVKAQGTKDYAAPELSRFGNQTDTLVDGKVDYFALGITLLECWTGSRPFQGIPDAVRLAQVRNKEVKFPPDIDPQLATLIKGLLNPLPRERWARDEVTRWIEGRPLRLEYSATRRPYESRSFNDQESFASPAELAALLQRYPTKGMDYLYLGRIKEWLDRANDMDLSTEVEKIAREFDKDEVRRRAGLNRAIYSLDPARPFVTVGGKPCRTAEDLGDALLAEESHYRDALANPLDPLYLYLQATGEGDAASALQALFLSGSGHEFAFHAAIYTLQAAGSDRIKIHGKFFYQPEDFKTKGDDADRAELQRQLLAKDSLALIWLKKLAYVGETIGLREAKPVDAMGLLKALDWLSFKTLVPDWARKQAQLANDLVAKQRADLLDIYVAQGMDFNCLSGNLSPLQAAAVQNRAAMVTYLLDHGAAVDYANAEGYTALCWAVSCRSEEAATTLIERSANPNVVEAGGATPLGMAASVLIGGGTTYAVSASLIRQLLEHGAKPDQALGNGTLPLHLLLVNAANPAIALDGLNAFLSRRADVNRSGGDVMGSGSAPYAPLYAAFLAYEHVFKRDAAYLKVIERLIDAGARLDARRAGRTVLHDAAGAGAEALCRLLVAKGASRLQQTSDGDLPVSFARQANAPSLVKFLSPGGHLWVRQAALLTLDYVSKAFVLTTLFFSLNHIAEVLRSLNPEGIWRIGLGIVLMQVLIAYVFLCLQGSLTDFRVQFMATLRNWRGAITYLVLVPLLTPLILGAISMAVDRAEFYVPSLRVIEALPNALARRTGESAWQYGLSTVVLLGLLLAAQLQIGRRANAIRQVALRLKAGAASQRQGAAIGFLPGAGKPNIVQALLKSIVGMPLGFVGWGRRHWFLLIVIGVGGYFLFSSLKQTGGFSVIPARLPNGAFSRPQPAVPPPELRMNVIYQCGPDGSFKVFSCTGMMDTAACDIQSYSFGKPYARVVLKRKQITDLISVNCHVQTPAEAAAHPHGRDMLRSP